MKLSLRQNLTSIFAWIVLFACTILMFEFIQNIYGTIADKYTTLSQSDERLTQIEDRLIDAIEQKNEVETAFTNLVSPSAMAGSSDGAAAYFEERRAQLDLNLGSMNFKLDSQTALTTQNLSATLLKHQSTLTYRGQSSDVTAMLSSLSNLEFDIEHFSISHLPDSKSEVWLTLTLVAFQQSEVTDGV